MTVVRKKLGTSSENLASEYLIRQGFQLIEKNYRCPIGEIDLIVRDQSHLVFVEVKSKRSIKYGIPAYAVNWRKQNKLVQLAKWYLKSNRIDKQSCRFDVVSIHWPLGEEAEIKHVRNAFSSRR